MKRYTYFFAEDLPFVLLIVALLPFLALFVLPDFIRDTEFGALDSFWFYLRLFLSAVLLLIAAGLYRHFLSVEIIRYAAQQRQFLRCVWRHTRWHTIRQYPQTQFSGIAAEEIYRAGHILYGRVFLRGQNGAEDLALGRFTPYRGETGTLPCYQKAARTTQLPMLGVTVGELPKQMIRPAQPDAFQTAYPYRTGLWQIIEQLVSAAVWAACGTALTFWLLAGTETLPAPAAAWLAQYSILPHHAVWALAALLWLSALSCSLKTAVMWRHFIRSRRNTAAVPVRDPLAVRRSDNFILFSYGKYVFWTAVTTLLCLILIGQSQKIGWFPALLLTAIGTTFALSAWNAAFHTRKLVYHAPDDCFTVFRLGRNLRWLSENRYAAHGFIGVACEEDGSLWLIGAAGGVDICLDDGGYFPQERIRALAHRISRTTGLPFAVRSKPFSPSSLSL